MRNIELRGIRRTCLKLAILAMLAAWGPIQAQEAPPKPDVSEYAQLMASAAQSLSESKLEAARASYARAVEMEPQDAERSQAALCLILTFESEGSLQDREYHTWTERRFTGARERDLIERALREYRIKVDPQAAAEGAQGLSLVCDIASAIPSPSSRAGDVKVGRADVHDLVGQIPDAGEWSRASLSEIGALLQIATPGPSVTLFSSSASAPEALYFLDVASLATSAGALAYREPRDRMLLPTLDVASGDLSSKVQILSYNTLIQGAERLAQQGKAARARLLFAKALAAEPEDQTLSRAATGIVLTFQEATGLNLTACKGWAQVNVPGAEDRLRIGLAVGELYYRNQDYDKAIAQLEDIARQKGHVAESASLVVALCLLGKGSRGEALETLRSVQEKSVSEEIGAKALFLIGWTHLQAQEYDAARTAFDALPQRYPKSQFVKKAAELSERLKSYAK